VLYVDAGNGLVPPVRENHGTVGDAERIKAKLIAETARADAIDGLALGEEDWRLGRDWLESELAGLPLLAANLACNGTAPFPPSRVVERGGLRVGIVGVTAGNIPGCEVSEPLEAAARARADLEVDFAVALMPLRLLRTSGDEALGFDLVVSGGEPVTYEELQPFRDGRKAAAGGKTKHIGTLELTTVEGGSGWEPDRTLALKASIRKTEQLLERVLRRRDAASGRERERLATLVARYEKSIADERARIAAIETEEGPRKHRLENRIVPLDETIVDHPETAARVAAAKARVTEVATAGEDMEELLKVPRLIPGGGPWAGAEACKGCHPGPYEQWSRTPHARAYAGLAAVDRAMDPECYSCHVTGADQEGGPSGPRHVGPYRDVQCESCHGPSGDHARSGGQAAPGHPATEAVCTTCHDGERDMGRFEYERYLPRVLHSTAPTAPMEKP
jgi:hypothetical protein